ncbi:protein-glutamate O-methyltransferase [Borrelia miyamotoi]|uniref:protein-glutamate O-methyltransferase n=1 Tax=Borrelia miyamotoi TaxID=47466 RepID=A0AAP8YS55_9SPIR|nr:protein-glutamate O-methyltransferase [Borrelia miyamotoi]ATQ15133.1 protein-glutamate O-methyltransferase [Borrelia miyamotoi]ATQ16315.1 protein-glutamate O-methyltransferase [Borrelia miyamotoi]ATQ17459.1 protein-glutamate O-methyltransferase [Borrelia miyamotoi]ATQ18039.1 protein-glutamate O-methyltransferase [Borrelia miyamotoi]ATQ19955.1 protein-glutamate O-methyltransferase [Borrelia miyamotoi]
MHMNNEFNIKINQEELNRLIRIIYNNFGINLNEKKKLLIESRLSSIIKAKNFSNFTEYIHYLENHKNQMSLIELVDKISTNHTYFFREPNHFEFLEKEILPKILNQISQSGEEEIRIWSSGCSSGEEPYTIAMILNEYISNNKIQCKAKILATDISVTVLNEANQGIYPQDRVKTLPKYLKTKYLNKFTNDKFEVKDILKKMIQFKKLNLMNEVFPFKKKFDLIFCRNVMIYFDEKTRNKLAEKFSQHLKDGSYLLIGHSETIRSNKNLEYIMPATYKKSIR